MTRITTLRSEAFRDIPAAGWQFDHAVVTPQLAKAKEYAENWDSFKQDGIGLLLFGDVGTGKSYAAGCIANALIDRMESVLFVGMADVVNRMQGNFGADRDRYIKSLMRPGLLILDDLGSERNTSFGKERRIYDRILEACIPVVFGGDSFRKTNAADNMKKAARYLKGASH